MDRLNFHHLYYFWAIAREGGVAPAARMLRVTHSTLSTQLRSLEEQLGAPLFERRGKRLVLTPFGAEAVGYADDIFRLGRELGDVARGRANPGREVLRVGVVAGLPKTLTYHLLSPALDAASGPVQVRQDSVERLTEALAAGRLHLVLCDEVPSADGARVHAHALGETEILWYAASPLARRLKKRFPASLQGAPFVLPAGPSALRRRIDAWLAERDLVVSVEAEVEDAGLLRVFGGAGGGVFPVRSTLKAEVEDVHGASLVGRCEGVREGYFVLSAERRVRHPAVVALIERARRGLHEATPRAARRR